MIAGLKIRTRIVLALSVFAYFLTVTGFLFPEYFSTTLDIPAFTVQVLGICFVVIVFTFLSIETRTRKSKRSEMVLVVSMFGWILFVPGLRTVLTNGTPSVVQVFPLLALVLLHSGMMLLLRLKWKNFQKRAEYTGLSLFSVGIGVYGLTVALALASIVAVHVYEKERNCTTFYRDLNSLSEKVDTFLFEGKNTLQQSVSSVMDFGSRSVGDALGLSQDQADQVIEKYEEQQQQREGTQTRAVVTGGVLGALQNFQTNIIGGILENRNAINQGVCAIVFDQLQKNIRQGIGSYSILLGLFFLLSPLLVFFLRVVGIVGRLVLRIALRRGRYKREEHTKVIREIE